METAVAGWIFCVRPPRPASVFATDDFSFSQQSVSQSSNSGWLAASLIESNVWSSPPSPLMDLNMLVERSRCIQVPHVRQLWNWDCGLAYVLMVLKMLGVEDCDLKYLSQFCQTTRCGKITRSMKVMRTHHQLWRSLKRTRERKLSQSCTERLPFEAAGGSP